MEFRNLKQDNDCIGGVTAYGKAYILHNYVLFDKIQNDCKQVQICYSDCGPLWLMFFK